MFCVKMIYLSFFDFISEEQFSQSCLCSPPASGWILHMIVYDAYIGAHVTFRMSYSNLARVQWAQRKPRRLCQKFKHDLHSQCNVLKRWQGKRDSQDAALETQFLWWIAWSQWITNCSLPPSPTHPLPRLRSFFFFFFLCVSKSS